MAKLYFRYSAMNAGKTTALLQAAHNYERLGQSVILIKPSIDTKGGDKVSSRLGIERKVDIKLKSEESARDRINAHIKAHGGQKPACIFVDESQFLTKEQVKELLKIATPPINEEERESSNPSYLDVPVICYGLRTDFCMNGFAGSTQLLLLAHSVEELKTVCACGKKATQNARIVKGEFALDGEQIAIDTSDDIQYESLCTMCYFKHKDATIKKRASMQAAHKKAVEDMWNPIEDCSKLPLNRDILVCFKNNETGIKSISTCFAISADDPKLAGLPIMEYSVNGCFLCHNRSLYEMIFMDAQAATHWMEIPKVTKPFSLDDIPLCQDFLGLFHDPETQEILVTSVFALSPTDRRFAPWNKILSGISLFFNDDDEDLVPVKQSLLTHWCELPDFPLKNPQ